MAEAAIELIGINKSFGAVRANRDINLEVERGTIHGIIGENGAGKSTLMSILYGFYQADSGEIRVGGKPISIKTPNDAIALGIGMVHQHFMLVENFTVIENVILGAEGEPLLNKSIAKARGAATTNGSNPTASCSTSPMSASSASNAPSISPASSLATSVGVFSSIQSTRSLGKARRSAGRTSGM